MIMRLICAFNSEKGPYGIGMLFISATQNQFYRIGSEIYPSLSDEWFGKVGLIDYVMVEGSFCPVMVFQCAYVCVGVCVCVYVILFGLDGFCPAMAHGQVVLSKCLMMGRGCDIPTGPCDQHMSEHSPSY